MGQKNLEDCNCIIAKSKNREIHEISYLLGKTTAQDIARRMAEEEGIHVSTTITQIHLDRHISLDTQEKVTEYLPSVASTCAQMLSRVKTRSMKFLDLPVLEDKEIKLLGILIKETSGFLDKLGDLTGEADSVHRTNITVAPSNFEEAAMSVLPEFPEAWIAIKNKLKEMNE